MFIIRRRPTQVLLARGSSFELQSPFAPRQNTKCDVFGRCEGSKVIEPQRQSHEGAREKLLCVRAKQGAVGEVCGARVAHTIQKLMVWVSLRWPHIHVARSQSNVKHHWHPCV